MYLVFLSLMWYAILSTTTTQQSLPEPDLVNVDAEDPLFTTMAPDDLPLFDETQGGPNLLTSNPSIYPEGNDEVHGDANPQDIPFGTISPSEVTDLASSRISNNPDESQNPLYDELIAGNPLTEPWPWDGSLSPEEAFPSIEKLIPLDSILGSDVDWANKCRDQPGKWPLCCRGQWKGGGQRNVDECDLCRLPSFICCCVTDYGCHVERIHFLGIPSRIIIVDSLRAQMTLKKHLGYVRLSYGNFAVEDIFLGYVRQS